MGNSQNRQEKVKKIENAKRSFRLSGDTIFWCILFAAGLVCIWKAQRAVPVMMDDKWYSTVLFDEVPLASMKDIFQAQVWHYNNWGGRTVAHTIAQLIFLYLSEPAADALNVALIVLLAWMINAVMGPGDGRRMAFVTLTVGFLHGLNSSWKMSMYWQTGACNYLYTTVIILAFLWMYLRTLDEERKDIPVAVLWAVILGLLAGWTNENMGPAVWVLTVLAMVDLKRRGRAVSLWMTLGSVSCLAGSILMIAAPGNTVRSTEVASNSYGLLWQIFLRMYGVCRGAWEYLFPAILVTAAALFVNVCMLGNRLNRKEIFLLAGAALSWGAMVLSPHYPDRAAFGTMCLLLCVTVSQAGAILRTKDTRLCSMAMAIIGVFIWLRGMYFLGEFLAIGWGWIR